MITKEHCESSTRKVLPNKETPASRTGVSEKRGVYVRSLTIRVSVTKISITIRVGDETIVIEVPIIASADQY